MNSRVILVAVMILAAGVGCAREDRWTLEGSGNEQTWNKAKSQPAMANAKSDVELVQGDGIATLRNKTSRFSALVTLHAVPGNQMQKPTDFQVLVPAMSNVQVGRPGRLNDSMPATEKWTYTVTKVTYK